MSDDWDEGSSSLPVQSYDSTNQPNFSNNVQSPGKGKILVGGFGRGFQPARRENNENSGRPPFRQSRDNSDFNGDNGGARRGNPRKNRDDDDSGGRTFNNDGNKENEDGEGEPAKPKRVTYIPPSDAENDEDLMKNSLNSGINFNKYDEIPVKVTGESPKTPFKDFKNAGFHDFILVALQKMNYEKPTPIQKHAMPNILAGRDIMGCAQTGSGKTAAFLLPMIDYLLQEETSNSYDDGVAKPIAVILAPTRELAVQISREGFKFTRGSPKPIHVQIVYGGVQVGHQLRKLSEGCDILVATPGRLLDFISRGKISFENIKYVVLDEADKMLEMGFGENIKTMMDHNTMVPKDQRQSLMFSATFPDDIQLMAKKYLENYVFIAVGIVGGACNDVEQRFVEVERTEKRNKLIDILKNNNNEKTMVFVATKRLTDFLASILSEHGISSTSIHGDREQQQREEALSEFKSGIRKVLVSTAVASRGLDIPDVRHVINYDLPKEIEEYVHRIGRTGRLGNKGLATSFFEANQDANLAPRLVTILKDAGQQVPGFLLQYSNGDSNEGVNNSFGGVDLREENTNLDEDWG